MLYFLYFLSFVLIIVFFHFLYIVLKLQDIDEVFAYYKNLFRFRGKKNINDANKDKNSNNSNNKQLSSVDNKNHEKTLEDPFPIKFIDELSEYERKVRESIYKKLQKNPPIFEDNGVRKMIVPLESLLFLNYDLNPLVNENGEITFRIKESPVIAELKRFLIELKDVDETIYQSDEELVDAIKALIIISKEYNLPLKDVTTMFVKKAKEKIEERKKRLQNNESSNEDKPIKKDLSSEFVRKYEKKVKTLNIENDVFEQILNETKKSKKKDIERENDFVQNKESLESKEKQKEAQKENINEDNKKTIETTKEIDIKKEDTKSNENKQKEKDLDELMDLSAGLEDNLMESLVGDGRNDELESDNVNSDIIDKTTVMIDDDELLKVVNQESQDDQYQNNQNTISKNKDNVSNIDIDSNNIKEEDYLQELGKLMEEENKSDREGLSDSLLDLNQIQEENIDDNLIKELEGLERLEEDQSEKNLDNQKEKTEGLSENKINVVKTRDEVIDYFKSINWQIFDDDIPFNIKKLDQFFMDNFSGNKENQIKLLINIFKHNYLIFNENKTNIFFPQMVIYNALAHMFDIDYNGVISKFKKMPTALVKNFQSGFISSFDFIISDLQTNGKKIFINQYTENSEGGCFNIHGIWIDFNALKDFMDQQKDIMDMYRAFPPCYKLKPVSKKAGCSSFLLDASSLEL